mgnify:FL=1
MKKYIKYLINIVVFEIIYILVMYLFSKSINWKMVFVTTIIYAVSYIVTDLICDKLKKE